MAAEPRSDAMSVIAHCPTCGESGPDVIDRVGDYGGDTFEARCGDEWHESEVSLRQQLQGAIKERDELRAAINAALRRLEALPVSPRLLIAIGGLEAAIGGQ